MTFVDASGRQSVRTRSRGISALAGLALVAALVAVMAALVDRATVTGQGALGQVAFGYPRGWLYQNRTGLDPSFPAQVRAASPWENPTRVAPGPLIGDVLIVYAVLLVGWFAGRSVLRRIRAAVR
jgi:hypothetical protein